MSLRKIAIERGAIGREVHVYYDSEIQEFRCELRVERQIIPEADYFTDDRKDAIATAKHMAFAD